MNLRSWTRPGLQVRVQNNLDATVRGARGLEKPQNPSGGNELRIRDDEEEVLR
jgi:hypothetical protein